MWRYQYPCHRSDTAHAVSINILQSPILLHLNYLSRVIRVYILSKPNPKWRIWLLVCLSWIFKSSIKKGAGIDQFGQLWCSRKGRGSAEMMAEGCQTQWLPQTGSDVPGLSQTQRPVALLEASGCSSTRPAAAPKNVPSAMTDPVNPSAIPLSGHAAAWQTRRSQPANRNGIFNI